MPVIRFLIDENVPVTIGEFLRGRGHDVTIVGEVLAKSSPDELLRTIAESHGYVVVTFDKDFKRLIRQLPEGTRSRFERRAGRISFTCNEQEAEVRIAELIRIIELHYEEVTGRGQRFIMQISKTSTMLVG